MRKTHHIVPHSGGGWDVKKGGAERTSKHFDQKNEAIDWGRQVSTNQDTELIIHGKDGVIQRSDSHGHDPCPPRDKK